MLKGILENGTEGMTPQAITRAAEECDDTIKLCEERLAHLRRVREQRLAAIDDAIHSVTARLQEATLIKNILNGNDDNPVPFSEDRVVYAATDEDDWYPLALYGGPIFDISKRRK